MGAASRSSTSNTTSDRLAASDIGLRSVYCGGQAGGGTLGSGDGPLQRSPDSGMAGTGAFCAGAVVASLSPIGRVWSVFAGAFSGAASLGDAAGDGATTGTVVPLSGAPCSTAGAYVVPQAATDSAASNRPVEILFIAPRLTTVGIAMFCSTLARAQSSP